jgi:hypothetical protein
MPTNTRDFSVLLKIAIERVQTLNTQLALAIKSYQRTQNLTTLNKIRALENDINRITEQSTSSSNHSAEEETVVADEENILHLLIDSLENDKNTRVSPTSVRHQGPGTEKVHPNAEPKGITKDFPLDDPKYKNICFLFSEYPIETIKEALPVPSESKIADGNKSSLERPETKEKSLPLSKRKRSELVKDSSAENPGKKSKPPVAEDTPLAEAKTFWSYQCKKK